jgi:hypothetical protein
MPEIILLVACSPGASFVLSYKLARVNELVIEDKLRATILSV